MDIAGVSMAISQINLGQKIDFEVLNLTKDVAEVQTASLIEMMEISTNMMELSVNSYLGGSVDIML